MDDIEIMEKIKTIVENWQTGDIDSSEAIILIEEVLTEKDEGEYAD
jgi:hypothetical protein